MEKINRPWGYYEVLLDEKNYEVKRITVFPKQRLSLQYHNYRDEYWIIIEGIAYITINNLSYSTNFLSKQHFIHKKDLHRIKNEENNNLIFIEVQTGNCDENDIVRLEDDYGREDIGVKI
jgi:mannose-6-phosphate isomerase-like protein (cupin superfamily)